MKNESITVMNPIFSISMDPCFRLILEVIVMADITKIWIIKCDRFHSY